MNIKPISREQYGVGYLGASNASNIVGNGPRSKIETYYNILGHPTRKYSKGIDYAYYGNYFEKDILKMFEELKDVIVEGRQTELVHPRYDFIRCHLDGYIEGGKGIIPVEAKLVNKYSKKEWLYGIPINYYYQIMTQMMLSTANKGYIAAAFVDWQKLDACYNLHESLDDLVAFEVRADTTLKDKILYNMVAFWEQNITPLIPPKIDFKRKDILFQLEILKKMSGERTKTLSVDGQIKNQIIDAYKEMSNARRDASAVQKMLDELKHREHKALAKLELLMLDFKDTDYISELGGRFVLEKKSRKGFYVEPSTSQKLIFHKGKPDEPDV